jgi:phosphate transport system permease protein
MPGIISASLLALSRALGETMIVVMAAGLRPNLSWNPLEDMTTVTVTIVNSLVGDFEFNSPETLSAFALGLMLFIVTLILNMISLSMIRKFKEKYKVNTL